MSVNIGIDLKAFENRTITEKKGAIGTRVDEKDMPNVMKTMLRMMGIEKGHNHREFRQVVCDVLGIDYFGEKENILTFENINENNKPYIYNGKDTGSAGEKDNSPYNVERILNCRFKNSKKTWPDDKLKKLWARHLFDTYTMLCTKIANNFIRYNISQPKCSTENKGGVYYAKKRRRHVNKLGAIDVLNDKGKIINILRYFANGKKYLAARGNLYLPGAPVPDKVEYGLLISNLNASIQKFASNLLGWCENGLRGSEDLKTIMNEMDRELSDILKKVDVNLEKNKCSSTIGQPWNKACNLKKCGQLLYSKCKLGNNVITGQLFSGKNSRSGKPKYKEILNDCIENLDVQKKEIVEKANCNPQ